MACLVHNQTLLGNLGSIKRGWKWLERFGAEEAFCRYKTEESP